MKYGLKITQTAGGESNISLAEAEGVKVDGGMLFTYRYDGADYRLTLTEDKISHTRLGEVCLQMNFERGKATVCTLSDGANRGSFRIFTDLLRVQFNGACATAECVFSDCAGGEATRITVLATPL